MFEPHSGEDYSRDEDHTANIITRGIVWNLVTFSNKYSRNHKVSTEVL